MTQDRDYKNSINATASQSQQISTTICIICWQFTCNYCCNCNAKVASCNDTPVKVFVIPVHEDERR